MKKVMIIQCAIVLVLTGALMLAFSSFEKDLQLSAVGLSFENDSSEIMSRMSEESEGVKGSILRVVNFPIGNLAIEKAGGVLPFWGALGQSILLSLLFLPLTRGLAKPKSE